MQNEQVDLRTSGDEVARILRTLIAAGDMSAGTKLDEVRLSARLGVSRTPIREAIISLEHEGWVRRLPNKGARVVAADERLVREIYPILGALECEAVRLSSERLVRSANALRQVNAKLRCANRRPEQHKLDAQFHRMLVEQCENPRLLALIESHWALARRFDGAFERGTANHGGSCDQHQEITKALSAGDVDKAAKLLREHWQQGVEVVCEWLRSNG